MSISSSSIGNSRNSRIQFKHVVGTLFTVLSICVVAAEVHLKLVNLTENLLFDETMTTPGGMVPTNLHDFTQRIPPGWKPMMRDYSFKAYLTRLPLWRRCCDVTEEAAGPLVASRLQGTAYEIAVKLRVVRSGVPHVGDAALALPSVAADAAT